MTDPTSAKSALRREQRRLRRATDVTGGSEQIARALIDVVADFEPAVVMVFDPVPGEPDLASFVAWCDERGIVTVVPDPSPGAADPIDPAMVDAVVVPGLAFTSAGQRLGQGGGWYDRFLARTRPGCLQVGVCFAHQLVATLPTEPHDRRMQLVITDRGPEVTPAMP